LTVDVSDEEGRRRRQQEQPMDRSVGAFR
jgi:hypothetical protein